MDLSVRAVEIHLYRSCGDGVRQLIKVMLESAYSCPARCIPHRWSLLLAEHAPCEASPLSAYGVEAVIECLPFDEDVRDP